MTNYYRIPDNVRFRDLNEKQQNILLHGDEEPDVIEVRFRTKTGAVWRFDVTWNGILGFMRDRYFKTESESVRADIEKYMSRSACPACKGSRYKPEALLITVGGKNISEIFPIQKRQRSGITGNWFGVEYACHGIILWTRKFIYF